ncbi:ferredoxin reductase-like protein [Gymnopus androsaceus JB14]|uniref:Ferredoxin reductase-like protein n=1 Tax=Gymnopus androsaceus JB14 TaxID=1447944 RepID=A0A6A4I9Q4_9AGAR|nr:ferredoxin reductase-like protein [Gymnopus androsaceus JB14]
MLGRGLRDSSSRGAPTSKYEKLSPSHFTPCTITASEPNGPNSRLITISIPPKYSDIQVERPYTPLEGIDAQGQMRFWIKKYPGGEVGRWLHSKKVGDEIEIRGPLQTWFWKDDDAWDEVVMISGGTGITPFYQLYHEIISQKVSPKTRFTLLHSSRSPSELPPPEIMQLLFSYAEEHPERFRLRVFVDSLGSNARAYQQSYTPVKYDGEQFIAMDVPFRKLTGVKTLFSVCGLELMVTAISGPYGRNFSQGPVKVVLADLGATSNQVYKL